MHYLRVYASIFVSSKGANDVYSRIGYVMHCFQCGHRFKAEEYSSAKCGLCGNTMRTGGQLWTGPFHDGEFVKKMRGYEADRQCKKVLDAAAEEASDIPYYFRADEISAKMKTNPSSVQEIIEKLKSSGFVASRTALNPGAFKTDAKMNQISNVLKE
jgi:tRNA (guanine26-N2/guanine27-N2)-dimethyltransferase